MVCQILNHHLNSPRLPYQVKFEVQTNITGTEVANVSSGFNQVNLIDTQLNEVKLFDSIFPSQMAEYQKRDTQLSVHIIGTATWRLGPGSYCRLVVCILCIPFGQLLSADVLPLRYSSQ